MVYRIARDGQVFGPYSEAEVRQYIVSGNIGPQDMAQADGSAAWEPVHQMFPHATYPGAVPPSAAPRTAGVPSTLYPDPPDFPWWAAALVGIVTGGLFFVVWDIVEANWLKKIDRNSTAILYYIGVAILYALKLPSMWSTVDYNVFGGPIVHTHTSGLGTVGFMLAMVARFVFRRELLDHFNQREGLPLRLSGIMTFFFGGLYFQYHFNRINELKRSSYGNVRAV